MALSGSFMALDNDPDNSFVAGFIGSPRMNFLKGTVGAGGKTLRLGGTETPLPELQIPLKADTEVQCGLRPEHLDDAAGVALPATVDVVERLGGTAYVHARLATGELIIAEQRATAAVTGGSLMLRFDTHRIRLFDASGQRLR